MKTLSAYPLLIGKVLARQEARKLRAERLQRRLNTLTDALLLLAWLCFALTMGLLIAAAGCKILGV